MLKHIIFILPLLFLQACNKDEKATDVPLLHFPSKKSLSFTEPATMKANWITVTAPKNKARVVKTKFSNYTEPYFYTNQFQPLIAPPDSLSFTLTDLPSKPFAFAGVKRKISPRIIKLGTPVKTKALFPVVNELATNGLMHLSTDQGLPSTVAAGIAQDKEGRLWIATEHGLCLYDGESFHTWFKQNGISRDELRFIYKDRRDHFWVGGSGVDEIIPSEGIIKHYGKQQIGQGLISVKEDAKGRLLFGLVEGLQIFDPATDTLTYFGPESGITRAMVNTLIVDNKQRIWLALNGGGVNIIDPSLNKIYYIDDKKGLSNNDIRDIMQDKNGNIWMGGWNGGVDYYNPESGKYYQLREKNGLCDRYIRCFNEDENGNIWIGCLSGGLDIYDPVTRKISHIYGKRGIVRSDCRSIFRDSFNRMWVSTNGSGILLYDAAIGTKDNFNTKWRSAKTAVNTVLEDAEGNFWIGTGGLGLDVVNVKEKTLKHLMNEDWTDGWINRLYDDSIGNIWMTTDYRLDKLNKTTGVVTSWGKDEGLPNEMVRSLSVCKNDIYLGTIGGLEKFTKGTETFRHLECKTYPLKNLISFMEFDKKGHLWMASYSDGLFELDTATMNLKHYGKQQGLNKVFIYSMKIDKAGNIWLGTGGDGLRIIDPVTKNITTLTVVDGLCEMTVLSLHENNGRMYAGTVKGLSVIETKQDHFEIDNYDKPQGFEATDFNQNSVMQSTDGRIWWGIGEVLTIFKPAEKKSPQGKTFITSVHVMEKELVTRNDHYLKALTPRDTIWSQTRDTFYFKETVPPDTGYFKTHNIQWSGIEGPYNLPKQLTMPYNQDHLTFHFSSNFLSNTNRTNYRYILEGADHSWSNPTSQAYVDYRNLSPGDYAFKVCSNNFNGPYTPVASFSFTILPPWWKTYMAYFIYAICFIGLIVGYNKLRTRQLLKRQRELEQNVKERTAQIEKQKDEIESQKLLVEEKQKEIVDSINYARRIQYTLLAHEDLLRKHLNDFFILFQPKDIVSGDFYWATAVTTVQSADRSAQLPGGNRKLFYLAVCDSTGHGVPGAFMSLLNISFLNEAINEKKIYSPDKILDYVRQRLINNLSQEGGRDGMDGILLCFDPANKRITYAAGNNGPLLYKNSSLTELGYNKMPIGKGEKTEPFTLHTIEASAGDIIYLYTDGFADQFGGPSGKKLKRKKLNHLIIEGAHLPLNSQQENLKTILNNWKGNLEQVDDVCVIGIKL